LNILIIRRDNIGDLLLTTPLFRALKTQLKINRLDLLTNTYSAPVIKGSPFIDDLYTYQKLKHGNINFFEALLQKIYLIFKLRKNHYDYILAFDRRAEHLARYLNKDLILTPKETWFNFSEVERVWLLGKKLGIKGDPGLLDLPPNLYNPTNNKRDKFSIGIHISARRSRQQYPIVKWVLLINKLHEANSKLRFNIFWSPGREKNPTHPGDDKKANTLKKELKNLPVRFVPTPTITSLINSMKICGSMIMADGGAMHIAAALNIPIIALFGDSNPKRWRPWGVKFKILSNKSQDVKDIKVDQIFKAWSNMLKINSSKR